MFGLDYEWENDRNWKKKVNFRVKSSPKLLNSFEIEFLFKERNIYLDSGVDHL